MSAYSHSRKTVSGTAAAFLRALAGVCLMSLVVFAAAVVAVAQTSGTSAQTAVPAPGQSVATPAAPTEEYRIGPGDELSVTFPNNAELNHDGPVGPDGRFALPLLGNLPLAGDSLNRAAFVISEALRSAGIVEDARTNVTVRRYGNNVYVGGQVKIPGVVLLASGMDAMQAIIAAGGMTDSAKTGQVAVIRRDAEGHPHVTYVNVKAYSHGKAGATIAVLEPRDIVFVPRSRIAEVDLWIDNYINKTIPFSRGINYSYGNYPVTTVASH